MNAILLWLWRKLTAYIEGALDPDWKARAEAFEAKVAEQEKRAAEAAELARQSEAAYLESVKNREEWDRLLAESKEREKESEERLRASQARITAITDEVKKLHEAIDSRSDANALRDRL
jgi:hypothetical protein